MSSKHSDLKDIQETQLLDSYEKSEDYGMVINDIYDTNIQLPTSDYTENISSDIHILRDETCVLSHDHLDCELIIVNTQEINKDNVEIKGKNNNDNDIMEEKNISPSGSEICKEKDAEVSVADTGDFSGFGGTPFKNLNNLIDDKKDRLIETPWLKNVKNPFDLLSPYRSLQQISKEKSQINAHEIFSRLRKDQSISPTIDSQKLESDGRLEKKNSAYDVDLDNENIQGTNLDKSELLFFEKDESILNENEASPKKAENRKMATDQKLFQRIEHEYPDAKLSADIISSNTSKIIASLSQDEHEKAVFGIMETQKLTQKSNIPNNKANSEIAKQISTISQDSVSRPTPDAIILNDIDAQNTQKLSNTFTDYFVKRIADSEISNDTAARIYKDSVIKRSQDDFSIFRTKSAHEAKAQIGITQNKIEDFFLTGNDSSKNDIQIIGTLDGISQDVLVSETQKIETLDVGATQPDQKLRNTSCSLSLTQRTHKLSPPESPVIEQSSPAVRESTDVIDFERLPDKRALSRLSQKSSSVCHNGYQLVTSSPNKNKTIEHINVSNKVIEFNSYFDSSILNVQKMLCDEVGECLIKAPNKNESFVEKKNRRGSDNGSSDTTKDKPFIYLEKSNEANHNITSDDLYSPNGLTENLISEENKKTFNAKQVNQTSKKDTTLREDSLKANDSEIEGFTSVWALYDIRIYPAKVLSTMDQKYNAQFYDGSLMINRSDILGPLDLMVGDNVKIHGKQELYIVTGLQKSENKDNKFKCMRGYDKVLLKRYIRHSISERYPEIQVSLWDIFIPNDIWSVRNRSLKSNDTFLEKICKTLEKSIIPESTCSQDMMNYYSYVSPEISPTKIKIKSNIFKNAIFCLTGELEENRQKITTMIVENGGTVLVNGFLRLFNISKDSSGNISSLSITKQYKSASFAAVITTQFSRSQKYLQCLALGWPTLSTSFIFDCIKYNKWLNYWIGYRLPAGESRLVKSIQGANISNFCLNLQRNSKIESQLQNNRHIFEGFHVILVNKKPSICEFLFHVLGVETLSYVDGYSEDIFIKAREIQHKNASTNILLYDQNDINHIFEKLLQVGSPKILKQKTSKKRALSGRLVTQASKRRRGLTDPKMTEKSIVKEQDDATLLEMQLCDWEWVVQCIISGVFWPAEKRFLICESM